MKRKLIKQGMSGYTIYLPKKWVDKKGLKAGEEVEVEEVNNALIIDSEIKQKKEITIEITEENKQDITNILTHTYRKGFDNITITNTNELSIKKIKETTNKLLGFEVTKKEKKSITIESISEPEESKYEVLLRRIFFIIKETQKITTQDFKKTKLDRFKELEELREQTDKYILFCRRAIIKELLTNQNLILNWELLTFLMHIQHGYYYLYKYSKDKINSTKNIIELLEKLEEYFDLFYNAFYNKNISNIHKINSLKNQFQYGKCYEYLEKSKKSETIILAHIRELFRLIQIGTSPILGMLFSKKTI
jgi:phosphate uptake regulator